jgi:hypothetical protein
MATTPVSGIAGGLGGILGGILGSNMSSAAQGTATNDANIANQILQEIGQAPSSANVILQKYQQAGVLSPEMQNNIIAQLPATVQNNPQIQQAQMQALQQMQQRANTGLTQGDRAALAQAQQSAAAQTQGQMGAIQQQMQQQGLSDSGTSLAMKLAAAQQGANQAFNNSNAVAQQSQAARDQALSNLGQYSTGLQGQGLQTAFQNQAAQQAMQRFNVQNQLGVQAQNTQAQNQAQAANLANAQNVGNMNTGEANNYNTVIAPQNAMNTYNANKNTAEVQAGGYGALAGYNTGLAQNQAQAGSNIGNGLGQLAGGIGAAAGMNQGGPVHNYRAGGQVNPLNAHEKAVVPGDSPANDKVHAILSAGEIVVPRTLAESKFGKHILKIIEAHNALKHHVNGQE